MKQIIIDFIPHDLQRYDTVGDWLFENDTLRIFVSETGDWRKNAAVAVHELVEALLCKDNGITQEQVDTFDMGFKKNDDPGDDPDAPYESQHCFATGVERMLIAAFGMSWKEYDDALSRLGT